MFTRLSAALALALTATSPAMAGTVSFTFDNLSSSGIVESYFGVGANDTATVTFDYDDTPAYESTYSYSTAYSYDYAYFDLSQVTLTINGTSISMDPQYYGLYTYDFTSGSSGYSDTIYFYDYYSSTGWSNGWSGSYNYAYVSGPFETFLDGTSPADADPSQATNGYLSFSFYDNSNGYSYGSLYSSSLVGVNVAGLAPVPLPAGLPMLLAGLGGLAWLRRRRG